MKHAMIIGRITKDAKLENRKVNGADTPVVNFHVAVNTPTSKVDESGRKLYSTDFYKVTLWRNYATAMAPTLLKGRKVAISGKDFTLETWMGSDNVVHPTLHFTNPDIEFQEAKPVTESIVEPEDTVTDDDLPFDA